ncbi:MAG: Na/Pi cotransporter family protein [Candidatus Omnitrophota bacterium]
MINVYDVTVGLAGGLGLFIYGIFMMGEGLQKAAGDRMRGLLKMLTGNPLMGAAVGTGITALIQSSSATTVLLVGFVNAGLMTLKQSIGVIFGANIGTTITAQIIAFKLTDLALPAIAVGVGLHFFSNKKRWKDIGLFFLGFGVLFLGLKIMTSQVKPLSQDPAVKQIFISLSRNPILGVLVGAIFTAIFQSSSVTTGLVITLATLGLIDISAAIYLILGCNIGTCITAILASIKANFSAKRAAVAHVLFNVFGTIIAFFLLPIYKSIVLWSSADIARQCANFHTVFNVVNTIIFLPLINYFTMLVTKIIPGKDVEIDLGPRYLEKHLLNTPPFAFQAATKEVVHMATIAKEMVQDSMSLFFQHDRKALNIIAKKEAAVDSLQESISQYLVELTQRELSEEISRKIPSMLHTVNDIERIADHAENLVELAERRLDENMSLSHHAMEELKTMFSQIIKMFDASIKALETNDKEEARLVLEIEQQINAMTLALRQNHIMRLNEGECKVLPGIVFLDTVSNFEKIGDHLNNIGQAVMGHLQWADEHREEDFVGAPFS